MLAAFLLTLRETLEAVLILGIVLSTLRATDQSHRARTVWTGALIGVVLSFLVAFLLNILGAGLSGRAEELFEGVMMLLAAGVLTWMIFWMNNQAAQISQNLREDVRSASQSGGRFALFSLAFLAVFREGVELSLFLTAASFTQENSSIFTGFLLGSSVAILIGWMLARGLMRLNISRFFQVTSVLLILFAGGLVGHGIHEFNEAGLIPGVIEHVWDLNPWIDEKSIVGQFMTAVFGYNANPSLTEVLAVILYYAGLLLFLMRQGRRRKVVERMAPSDS